MIKDAKWEIHEDRNGLYSVGTYDNAVCHLWELEEETHNKIGFENAEEHARLIAAAPDLLEALRPFAGFADDDWETHGCFNCIAKRAVVKATTQTPF